MPEERLFRFERTQSRADVASYLRQVADSLDAGEPLTLRAGEQSVTLTPPATPTFEVTAEREGPAGRPGEVSVEFELEWDERDGGDDSLEIE
ncbi:MAG: amphi-Trp domain-containing protein [Haloplanus sp.]